MKLHSLGLFSNRPLFRDKRTSAPSVGTTFPGSWTLDQIFWPLADCKWKSIKQNDSLNRPIRMSIHRVDSIKFNHIFQDLNRISRLHSMLVSKPMLNLTWFGFDGSWYHFNYFVKMLISLDYKLRDAAIFQIALSWFFFFIFLYGDFFWRLLFVLVWLFTLDSSLLRHVWLSLSRKRRQITEITAGKMKGNNCSHFNKIHFSILKKSESKLELFIRWFIELMIRFSLWAFVNKPTAELRTKFLQFA